MINRYGFNSVGADVVQDNLEAFGRKARSDPSVKPGTCMRMRVPCGVCRAAARLHAPQNNPAVG